MNWRRNPLIPRVKPLNSTAPRIPPVLEGTARPFFSVMIPTIDRPHYLRELLESILLQDPGVEHMQIMVVDNASTAADIGALVQEIGGGRVEYFRQAERVPFAENFNTCLRLSRGAYVHLMHDDDLVLPGCYAAYRAHIEQYGCSIVLSQIIAMNDQKERLGVSNPVKVVQGIVQDTAQILWQPDTFALNTLIARRDLYEQVGGYHDGILFGADYEICARLFEVGVVGFLPEPYVLYRFHPKQTSRIYWERDLYGESLPGLELTLQGRDRALFRHQLYNNAGYSAYSVSRVLFHEGHPKIALRQAQWGFRFYPTAETLNNLVTMWYRWRIEPIYRRVRGTAGKIKRGVFRWLRRG
ncbi:MAG: hypothetical protein OHK0046_24410 [Anaerolineae bacterium]